MLLSRPTENETRPKYAWEWQYYYSSAAGTADLGLLQPQFAEHDDVLASNGARVNYIEPPVPAIGARPATGTSAPRMDTVTLTVDERTACLAPHLVSYGFVRELVRRDYTIVRCPWRRTVRRLERRHSPTRVVG